MSESFASCISTGGTPCHHLCAYNDGPKEAIPKWTLSLLSCCSVIVCHTKKSWTLRWIGYQFPLATSFSRFSSQWSFLFSYVLITKRSASAGRTSADLHIQVDTSGQQTHLEQAGRGFPGTARTCTHPFNWFSRLG